MPFSKDDRDVTVTFLLGKKCSIASVGNPKERDNIGELGVYGRIRIKWTSNEHNMRPWIKFAQFEADILDGLPRSR